MGIYALRSILEQGVLGICRIVVAVSLLLALAGTSALADTADFGGHPDKFGGGGDKTPPRCQINVPRAATSAFFVKWDCNDDVSSDNEIRTELWIQRLGASAPRKIGDFLGFPASVQIDESILHSATVTDGLPASFRLLARDRAGIGAFSPVFTVQQQDNSLDSCDLVLVTDTTEADGGSTGLPALTVSVNNAAVQTQQSNSNDVAITTIEEVVASPCEITEICGDPDSGDNEVQFGSTLVIGSDDASVTGSVNITPGDVLVEVEGSAVVSESELASISTTGTTIIDGVVTNVTFNCE